MCQPTPVEVFQFGWGGETSWGFVKRINYDVVPYKPTLVTTCYGMNDAGYRATDPKNLDQYREAMAKIVEVFQGVGARVIVGSPGVVDQAKFNRATPAAIYNQALADFGKVGSEVAQATGSKYADIHTPMMNVMHAAQAKLGDDYHVAGNDGVHPAANGHLVMAYGFLKAMGLDGEIGTIKVNLTGQTATASADHQIKEVAKNVITVESKRYPFCFGGDPKSPNATSGIIEFFPFNQDLNRFMLVVPDATADKYNVTWGTTTVQYTKDQLHAGVNLAADFVPNPFNDAFNLVERSIRQKQAWETTIVRGLFTSLRNIRTQIPNDPSFDAAEAVVKAEHQRLAKRAKEVFVPVTHTIQIEAVPAQ
jgi:lysophospholipase L1-like esterase